MNILVMGLLMERLLPVTARLCRQGLGALNTELKRAFRELEIWCHHYLDDFIYSVDDFEFYVEDWRSDLIIWYYDLKIGCRDFRIRRIDKWLASLEVRRAARSDNDLE